MKNIYLILMLSFTLAVPLAAQQQFELAQYYQNPHALNPAFTGIEKYWQANAGYFKVWAGASVSSEMGFTSVNGSFYKPDIRLNAIRISRPEAYEENLSNKEYRKMNARHGLGAYYGYTKLGADYNDQATITYAYHLPLTRKLNMSVGTGVTYANAYLSGGEFKVRTTADEVYAQLKQMHPVKRQLSINTGVSLYTPSFYLGYSTTSLAFFRGVNDQQFAQQVNYVEHAFSAGYQLALSPSLRLQPAVLLNYDRLREASVYGNIKLRYQELVWAGVSFRNKEAYGLLVGFLLNDRLNLGYAYEQNIYKFDAAHNGNHEVVLGYRFFRKGYRVNTYFW